MRQFKVKKIIIGITIIVLLIIGSWKFYYKNPSYQLFGEIIDRVETVNLIVALTFDDGPLPGSTQNILSILAKSNVKATFFLIGSAIIQNSKEASLIHKAGHEIGNHSYSHKRMVLMDYKKVAFEIEKTNEVIRDLGYKNQIYFRPPYGRKLFTLPYYLSRNDIVTITWDIEPERWDIEPKKVQNITAEGNALAQYVIDNTKPGSIILLHVMGKNRGPSMSAVPEIIQGLKAKGYQFKTVSELLSYNDG